MRVEHNLANAPVMLYAGLGHTERFPDYWELFSPKFGPAGSTSAFEGVKAKKPRRLISVANTAVNNLGVALRLYWPG